MAALKSCTNFIIFYKILVDKSSDKSAQNFNCQTLRSQSGKFAHSLLYLLADLELVQNISRFSIVTTRQITVKFRLERCLFLSRTCLATPKSTPVKFWTQAFSVLKCKIRYYPQKTEICNIGGLKKYFCYQEHFSGLC